MAGYGASDTLVDQPASGGYGPNDTLVVQKQPKSGLIRRGIGDTAVSALKGAIAVPEAAVGLADIATGGRVGKALENRGGLIGFRPQEAKAALEEWYSPEQKEAFRAVREAEGFLPTLQASIENPSTIGQTVVESVPSMLAGGVVGRGLMKAAPSVGRVLGVGAGEGIVGAGLAAEDIRQQTETGLLTPKQAALAAGSGAATGLIAGASGALANRLGIGDINQMILSGKINPVAAGAPKKVAEKGVARRIGEGALVEGPLQELPQSASEQEIQNIALDRPVGEGVGSAAAQGLLAGTLMGGAAGPFVSSQPAGPQPAPPAAPAAGQPGSQQTPLPVSPAPQAPPVTGPLTAGVAAMVNTGARAIDAGIVSPREANQSILDEIRALEPAEQAEAFGLLDVAGNMASAPHVRRYAQNRLDQLLADVRQIPAAQVVEEAELLPTAQATEISPGDANAILAQRGPFRTPEQIAEDGGRDLEQERQRLGIPAPEVTETVLQDAPQRVDLATRLAELRARGGKGRPFQLNEDAIAGQQQPVEQAAQAQPSAFMQRVATARARARNAAMAALAGTAQPTDIKTADGYPYGTRDSAIAAAKRNGLDADSVVEVEGGFVPRPPADVSPADTPVAELAPRRPESDQDRSWREWGENYSRVTGTADLGAVSTQALERAEAFAANRVASEQRKGWDGGAVNTAMVDGFQREIGFIKAELAKRRAAREAQVAPAPTEQPTPSAQTSAARAPAATTAPAEGGGGPARTPTLMDKMTEAAGGPVTFADIKRQDAEAANQTQDYPERWAASAWASGLPDARSRWLAQAGMDARTPEFEAMLESAWNGLPSATRERVRLAIRDEGAGGTQPPATQPAAGPVAESQAPAPSEPGEGAVGRTQDGGGPQLPGRRTLDEDGRASDGKPIMPGDVFATKSGRTTTPYPKQRSEKFASQWLIDNAVAEAESRGDKFNATSFRGEQAGRDGQLPPATRDSMLMYLFGWQPPIAPSILRPLAGGGPQPAVERRTEQTEEAVAAPRKRPPPSELRKVAVTTRVFDEETASFKDGETNADAALKAIDDDIAAMREFIKCLRGG